MSKPVMSICPIHHQADAGNPPRCLKCEPNQREAEFVRQKITPEEFKNLPEEKMEIIVRYFDMKYDRFHTPNN